MTSVWIVENPNLIKWRQVVLVASSGVLDSRIDSCTAIVVFDPWIDIATGAKDRFREHRLTRTVDLISQSDATCYLIAGQ